MTKQVDKAQERKADRKEPKHEQTAEASDTPRDDTCSSKPRVTVSLS